MTTQHHPYAVLRLDPAQLQAPTHAPLHDVTEASA